MNDVQVEYQPSEVAPERKPNDRKNDRTKVDRYEVSQLRRKGMSYGKIAKQLGVSKSSVWVAAREVNVAVVRCASLEVGHRVAQEHLDTLGQLQKINSDANEILDLMMRWNRGDEGALQILESQVKKVRHGQKEEEAVEFKFKDPRDLALKAMAEIRNQLSLQLDIMKTLYDVKDIADFQRAVIETIGRQRPEVRIELIDALKAARALRLSAQIRP